MGKLYYCKNCKRIIEDSDVCQYCKGENIKELSIGKPVNVLGTKLKGEVLKYKDGKVQLLIRGESNNKYLKEYDIELLRKVL